MSILSDLTNYIEELEATNAECARPGKDGEPCVQCFERERVLRRLTDIIAHYVVFSNL